MKYQIPNNLTLKQEIKPEADEEQKFKPQANEEDDDESFASSLIRTPKREKINFQSFQSSTPNNSNTLISSKSSPTYGYNRSQLDKSYGPYFDLQENTSKLGTSTFRLDNNNQNIIIGNEVFKTTDGLRELIFKKKPNIDVYTESDLHLYQKILETTNAHRRNYDSLDQIKGNKGYKYKNIIRKLFDHEYNTRIKNKKGDGYNHSIKNSPKTAIIPTSTSLMTYSEQPKQYIYWDDPNELINRLKILHASQLVGNNNHRNEINSILEELREADIIE